MSNKKRGTGLDLFTNICLEILQIMSNVRVKRVSIIHGTQKWHHQQGDMRKWVETRLFLVLPAGFPPLSVLFGGPDDELLAGVLDIFVTSWSSRGVMVCILNLWDQLQRKPSCYGWEWVHTWRLWSGLNSLWWFLHLKNLFNVHCLDTGKAKSLGKTPFRHILKSWSL